VVGWLEREGEHWRDYRGRWRFLLDWSRDRGLWRYTKWMGAKWQPIFMVVASAVGFLVLVAGLFAFSWYVFHTA